MPSAFIVIAVCLISGLLLRRFKVLPDNSALVLNQYVIYLALPALILAKVPFMTLSAQALWCMAIAWIALVFSAILVWLLARWFAWPSSTRCVLLLLVPLGNTSFVGIPLIDALLGEAALGYAILYDQLGSFLALSSYGALVLALHSPSSLTQVSVRQIVRKIISFPPFLALAAALFLGLFKLLPPDSQVAVALNTIGNTLVPVVMVAVGFQWQFKLPKADLLPFSLGLAIKLVIAPLFIGLLLAMLQLPPLQSQALFLESAMAPMISAGALLMANGHKPELTSALVGYGLLFGFMTVPLWWCLGTIT